MCNNHLCDKNKIVRDEKFTFAHRTLHKTAD